MERDTGPLDALVVMGKCPRPGDPPLQLEGRAALAALLWHNAPESSRPSILSVEGHDLPGDPRSGGEVVAQVLMEARVDPRSILCRSSSCCTVMEVRAIRHLLKKLGARSVAVITHAYHQKRTRRYFRESGIEPIMIPCHPREAEKFPTPNINPEPLLHRVRQARISPWESRKERVVEALLGLLHALNRRGNLEMALAHWIRRRFRNRNRNPDSRSADR